MNVNARRIVVINTLSPLVGKAMKETFAQTMFPILKIPSLILTILQVGFTSTLNDDEICFNNMHNNSEVGPQGVQQ